LRALRRGSRGGRPRPRDERSAFDEEERRFGSDDAAAAGVGKACDVADALSRDECRVLVLLTAERVTTATRPS